MGCCITPYVCSLPQLLWVLIAPTTDGGLRLSRPWCLILRGGVYPSYSQNQKVLHYHLEWQEKHNTFEVLTSTLSRVDCYTFQCSGQLWKCWSSTDPAYLGYLSTIHTLSEQIPNNAFYFKHTVCIHQQKYIFKEVDNNKSVQFVSLGDSTLCLKKTEHRAVSLQQLSFLLRTAMVN